VVICFVFVACRDPNLWVVKCRMGEEKDVVVHLMRKVIAYQFTEEVRCLGLLVMMILMVVVIVTLMVVVIMMVVVFDDEGKVL